MIVGRQENYQEGDEYSYDKEEYKEPLDVVTGAQPFLIVFLNSHTFLRKHVMAIVEIPYNLTVKSIYAARPQFVCRHRRQISAEYDMEHGCTMAVEKY